MRHERQESMSESYEELTEFLEILGAGREDDGNLYMGSCRERMLCAVWDVVSLSAEEGATVASGAASRHAV